LGGLKVKVKIVSIIAIAWLETAALLKGIDGSLLALAFSAIGGIGGYHIGRSRKRRR
jgi:hypothetical protein